MGAISCSTTQLPTQTNLSNRRHSLDRQLRNLEKKLASTHSKELKKTYYPQVLKTLARFIEGTPQVHTFDVVTSTLQQHELVTA